MYPTRIEKCIYEKVQYSTMAESYDIYLSCLNNLITFLKLKHAIKIRKNLLPYLHIY